MDCLLETCLDIQMNFKVKIKFTRGWRVAAEPWYKYVCIYSVDASISGILFRPPAYLPAQDQEGGPWKI